jgi:hypothetical protein
MDACHKGIWLFAATGFKSMAVPAVACVSWSLTRAVSYNEGLDHPLTFLFVTFRAKI